MPHPARRPLPWSAEVSIRQASRQVSDRAGMQVGGQSGSGAVRQPVGRCWLFGRLVGQAGSQAVGQASMQVCWWHPLEHSVAHSDAIIVHHLQHNQGQTRVQGKPGSRVLPGVRRGGEGGPGARPGPSLSSTAKPVLLPLHSPTPSASLPLPPSPYLPPPTPSASLPLPFPPFLPPCPAPSLPPPASPCPPPKPPAPGPGTIPHPGATTR
ncbi:hypothetical protein V8C86DRAFT_1360593 [Haematococcus lacustris]